MSIDIGDIMPDLATLRAQVEIRQFEFCDFDDDYNTRWTIYYKVTGRSEAATRWEPGVGPDIEIMGLELGGAVIDLDDVSSAFLLACENRVEDYLLELRLAGES